MHKQYKVLADNRVFPYFSKSIDEVLLTGERLVDYKEGESLVEIGLCEFVLKNKWGKLIRTVPPADDRGVIEMQPKPVLNDDGVHLADWKTGKMLYTDKDGRDMTYADSKRTSKPMSSRLWPVWVGKFFSELAHG